MGTIINLQEKNLAPDCYVYKHSTACPISASAAEVIRSVDLSMPVFWINIIEQRHLSDWVEEEYNTRHESPQLLEIRDGKVAKVWNHRAINREEISSET